jgi:hypothetical protein
MRDLKVREEGELSKKGGLEEHEVNKNARAKMYQTGSISYDYNGEIMRQAEY